MATPEALTETMPTQLLGRRKRSPLGPISTPQAADPRHRSVAPAGPINVLTVDVEDYFHVSAFEQQVSRRHWDQCESRVVGNTHRLLELLAAYRVQATFFVLGWVAERYPQLVEEIHRQGHEVGSHGYSHRLVYSQTQDEFRRDLRRSRKVLDPILGAPVVAYRAPSFSIVQRSRWALEILVEEGFRVDSSIFPIYHDRYGLPGAPARLHRVETPAGALWEFPPSVARFGRWNLPISGGGYFRLYPFRWTRYCLRRVNRRDRQSFMFYIHPWEVDPRQPRLRGSRLSRFRHYVNLASTEQKFRKLLTSFRFARLCDAIAEAERQVHATQWRAT